MLIFEGKEISTDSEGYLKETTQWSEALAVAIAANEGIELSAETLGSRALRARILPGV
ncbi:tRNA 2-thiouridine synthesizing protein E [Salmonella enterica subsp. enterica]|uniref:Sulfurtransferase TusE n=1 Tax=Salmonella enterica I TaxID=59201 RepID=A0A447U5K1_SALET|nr:tRNA 2-thiouridine synthesizing protein E [Salmonella enterica subsp. enterica]